MPHTTTRRAAAIIVLAASSALAGCSTTPRWLENRLTCTAAGGEALVVSRWGPVGIAADIARADAEVVCPPRR